MLLQDPSTKVPLCAEGVRQSHKCWRPLGEPGETHNNYLVSPANNRQMDERRLSPVGALETFNSATGNGLRNLCSILRHAPSWSALRLRVSPHFLIKPPDEATTPNRQEKSGDVPGLGRAPLEPLGWAAPAHTVPPGWSCRSWRNSLRAKPGRTDPCAWEGGYKAAWEAASCENQSPLQCPLAMSTGPVHSQKTS